MSTPKEINAYLARALVALDMTDWRVQVSFRVSSEGACAECEHLECRRGWIRLGAEFWQISAEDQVATLAHELLHFKAKWWSELSENVCSLLKRPDQAAWSTLMDLAEENLVEGLSRVVARLMPPLRKPFTRGNWWGSVESEDEEE